ncbi:MAG: NTP transferase domain-containing protein [Clostridia bacterium]|nr:NTP transferase domain-containing protein [Clostridia bacterium]
MANATLVVMAAGMGSRFGGCKQLEPVGTAGEVLLDYSVYDAKRAGFDKVVFIIKEEIEKDFKEIAGDRIARNIEVEYAYQTIPSHRKKPYGTGDAILTTKNLVDTPFVVINADDFYGHDAFVKAYEGLKNKDEYCMVGYRLKNTLSDNGSVARGVCSIKDGYLAGVTEHTAITKDTDLDPDTIVSMNMWGIHPDIFPELEAQFAQFLATANIEKDEFYIPMVIDKMIKDGKKQVRMYDTSAVWYGMTYREDKEKVMNAIKGMVEEGIYPKELWS